MGSWSSILVPWEVKEASRNVMPTRTGSGFLSNLKQDPTQENFYDLYPISTEFRPHPERMADYMLDWAARVAVVVGAPSSAVCTCAGAARETARDRRAPCRIQWLRRRPGHDAGRR